MLKVKLLQTPKVELDGKSVSLPFKRAEALLYYMIVRRSATRQELVSLLWESEDESKGLKNLRNAIYTLKKTLGGEILLSPQKSIVVLNPEWDIESDYEEFTRSGELSVYQGPFLQGFTVKNAFAMDEWICRNREKLHGQYLHILEERSKAAHRAGNLDEAIRWVREFLAEEPFDEEAVVFLMRCYQQTHRFAAAAQVYQQLKEQLSKELGADPLESTTMFYYEILNNWNDTSRPLDPSECPAPVGRERIYNVIRAAASSFLAQPTRCSAHLLLGEAGSGKSELLNFFLRQGEFPSLFPIRCEFLRSERQNPSQVWYRILHPLLELAQQENFFLPDVVTERIRQTFSVEEHTGPIQFDQKLEESILLLFDLVGRDRKILLLLEDLQWADRESLEPLQVLLRNLKRGTLLTILTSTWVYSPQVQKLLDELEADGLLQQQVLKPLSIHDTAEFLRRELGPESADALADRFYHETGGNLKLLTGLTQAYRQNSDVDDTLKSLSVILMDRLRDLSPDAREVVQKLSLFREGVSSHLLLALMDGREQQLTEALKELHRREIVEEFRTESGSTYAFIHSRLRELVYDRLTSYERSQLHRQAAEALVSCEEQSQESGKREISWHYAQAGDRLAALAFRLQALNLESGRRCEPFCLNSWDTDLPTLSLESLAQEAEECQQALCRLSAEVPGTEALRSYEMQLTLVRSRLALYQGDPETAYQLLGSLQGLTEPQNLPFFTKICELLATAACYQQSADRTERYVTTGMRLLERYHDEVQLARFYRLRGSCFCLHGDYDRAGYYLQEAVEILNRQPPSPGIQGILAAAYGDLGRIAGYHNDFVHAVRWFKQAVNLLDQRSCAGQVWLYVHYGRTVFSVGDHLKAKALFAHAYAIAKETGELWGRCAAAAYSACYLAQDEEFQLAAEALADAKASAERVHSPLENGILYFAMTRIRIQLDQEQRMDSPLQKLLPACAEEYARRGIRLCQNIPDAYEVEHLSKNLRDGISSQLRYRSSELYSKNKRYMAE